MKVKIEIDLEKATYETLDKLAKSLTMKNVEELLQQELEGSVENIELWLDRPPLASELPSATALPSGASGKESKS